VAIGEDHRHLGIAGPEAPQHRRTDVDGDNPATGGHEAMRGDASASADLDDSGVVQRANGIADLAGMEVSRAVALKRPGGLAPEPPASHAGGLA
jgi:hypothetical protein